MPAAVTIRDVPDWVLQRVKVRARADGGSEQLVWRKLLASALNGKDFDPKAEAQALRERTRGGIRSNSTEIIRAMRDKRMAR